MIWLAAAIISVTAAGAPAGAVAVPSGLIVAVPIAPPAIANTTAWRSTSESA